MTKIIGILVLVGVFFVFAGINNWFGLGFKKIIGSGNVIEKKVNVSNFNKISLAGMGNLIIEQGDEESLKIEAEDNILDKIIVQTKNEILDISYGKALWNFFRVKPTKKINYHIKLKNLNEIKITGSGSATSELIKTENLSIIVNGSGKIDLKVEAESIESRVSGSGNFDLSGSADSQKLNINGSGKYFAKELVSKSTTVKISGSGKAEVDVKEELDVSINGSGSVFYVGDPKISQEISGSGKIQKFK